MINKDARARAPPDIRPIQARGPTCTYERVPVSPYSRQLQRKTQRGRAWGPGGWTGVLGTCDACSRVLPSSLTVSLFLYPPFSLSLSISLSLFISSSLSPYLSLSVSLSLLSLSVSLYFSSILSFSLFLGILTSVVHLSIYLYLCLYLSQSFYLPISLSFLHLSTYSSLSPQRIIRVHNEVNARLETACTSRA